MSSEWDQAPGVYDAFELDETLIIGPHCRFTRGGLTLNDRSLLETFWVDDLAGFESADIAREVVANTGSPGELSSTPQNTGRTMTLTGWIQAGSYPKLMRLDAQLTNVFNDLRETSMLIDVAEGSIFRQPPVEIYCAPSDRLIISKKIEQGDITGLLKRQFTIAMRAMTNPFFTSIATNSNNIHPTVVNRLGMTFPLTFPLVFDHPMDPAQNPIDDNSNNLTVTNAGTGAAIPGVTVKGPFEQLIIVNQTTGQSTYISHLDADTTIDIDMASGSVYDQTGALRNSLRDARSDWMTLAPGDNQIQVFASDFSQVSKVFFFWKDTWR